MTAAKDASADPTSLKQKSLTSAQRTATYCQALTKRQVIVTCMRFHWCKIILNFTSHEALFSAKVHAMRFRAAFARWLYCCPCLCLVPSRTEVSPTAVLPGSQSNWKGWKHTSNSGCQDMQREEYRERELYFYSLNRCTISVGKKHCTHRPQLIPWKCTECETTVTTASVVSQSWCNWINMPEKVFSSKILCTAYASSSVAQVEVSLQHNGLARLCNALCFSAEIIRTRTAVDSCIFGHILVDCLTSGNVPWRTTIWNSI